jgi:sirohydrochlorin cobaltochelatase
MGDHLASVPGSSGGHANGQTGILLIGHGTREAVGLAEFHALTRLAVDAAVFAAVEPCFLEFAMPTISQGFDNLLRRGVEHVVVVPVLLFSAGHAERDIPHAIDAAQRAHPRLAIRQAAHLGCHADILELSHARYEEAIASRPAVAPDRTTLLLVGRGSHSASATAEMLAFAAERRARSGLVHAQACFVAMAEPPLDRALRQAAGSGASRIVVQPHLLFGGVLADRIGRTVAAFGLRHPEIEWIVTRHLGPSALVVRALLDRALAGGGQTAIRHSG